MKRNCFVILFFSLTFLFISCSPRNIVRKNEFLRNLIYPEELKSDFSKRSGLGDNTPGNSFDHSDYGTILNKYINKKGMVNYVGLKTDEKLFDQYLNSLANVDYEKLSKYEKLALLINAYNAFTLKLIIQNPGIGSIKDIPSDKRWENEVWNIAGNNISLGAIEHEWIRKDFGEPKIHFALVCAAMSCPKLRNEPYSGDKLKEQLNDQARNFFSVEKNFRWDPEKKEIHLSAILDWFRYDFAATEEGVLEYSLNFIDTENAKEISLVKDTLNIKYISYDWSLNGDWK